MKKRSHSTMKREGQRRGGQYNTTNKLRPIHTQYTAIICHTTHHFTCLSISTQTHSLQCNAIVTAFLKHEAQEHYTYTYIYTD